MRRSFKITLAMAGLPVVTAIGFILWAAITFEEETVRESAAYGFSIGETSAQAYARAAALRSAGEFAEIRRGTGSAAVPIDDENIASALADDAWTIVVNPDWWNDSITLRFRDHTLVEIYRFRFCCELP